MRAGSLKHIITVQQLGSAQDSYGDQVQSWQAVSGLVDLRANVQPIQGREYIEMHSQNIEVDHRVKLRYRSGITNKMRIIWGSVVLQIIDVIDYKAEKKELHLMCVNRGETP
jgi:SPP1 family predicted phage head-tail adaptor